MLSTAIASDTQCYICLTRKVLNLNTTYLTGFIICLFPAMVEAQSSLYLNDVLLHVGNNATLTIQGDATFSGSASVSNLGAISVTGDWENATNGDLFAQDSGEVLFNGSALQSVSGSTAFHQLEVDNASGVTITDGQNQVTHTLTLTTGLLTTNDSLYLTSDAERTARVAQVTGGSAAGDFILERYIPYAGNNWRMLSMPVQGGTLQEWYDDFVTSGFTGAQYPSYYFASIYFYNESTLGTADQGFEVATNITNPVPTAGGAWAYIGPLPATVDVKGEINTGAVNFPVTYTDDPSEAADQDGWNQVGNPYPSAIDWDASSGWTKTNINNAVYVWDGELDQYRTYVGGIGTNGGISKIASMQSFFVQSNAASPVLTATEAVKISDDVEFVNQPTIAQNMLRMSVEAWGYPDETVLRFDSRATAAFDKEWDAFEVPSRNIYAPSLASQLNGAVYSINSLNPAELSAPIAINLKAGWPGMHVFTITEVPILPSNYCLYLEDVHTGIHYPLDSSLSFTAFADTGAAQPRFLLHSYRALDYEVQSPVCHDDSNAFIRFSPAVNASFNVSWFNGDGELLFDGALDSAQVLQNLKAGNYQVLVNDSGSCGTLTETVTIPGRDSLWLSTQVEPAFAEESLGFVAVQPIGGVKPYSIHWTHPVEQLGPNLELVPSDTYHLEVTDAVGCKLEHSVWVPEFSNTMAGVEEHAPELEIYPNPTQGILTMVNHHGASLQFVLRDVLGRKVYTQTLSVSKSTLDLSFLPNGIYHLALASDIGFSYAATILIQAP